MRIICSMTLTTGALAPALTFIAPPAEAGPACNRIGLNSPCIKSNDLKARLNLDERGRDARLRLKNAARANAVDLDARSANVTNLFANEPDASNGLVKAWAQINGDGTVFACWRCSTDPNETRRLATGTYEVDFTPLSADVRGRPRSATIDGADGDAVSAIVLLEDRAGDASSVFVGTVDLSDDGVDAPFVLVIY